MNYSPQEFWDAFVAPAIEDWIQAPLSVRHATTALCELDNLLEHTLQYQEPGIERSEINVRRNEMGAQHPELKLARDVHDTHKHGQLSRRSAIISQAQRPRVARSGGALLNASPLNSFTLNEAPRSYLVIVDDAGRFHELAEVIAACRDYWMRNLV